MDLWWGQVAQKQVTYDTFEGGHIDRMALSDVISASTPSQWFNMGATKNREEFYSETKKFPSINV